QTCAQQQPRCHLAFLTIEFAPCLPARKSPLFVVSSIAGNGYYLGKKDGTQPPRVGEVGRGFGTPRVEPVHASTCGRAAGSSPVVRVPFVQAFRYDACSLPYTREKRDEQYANGFPASRAMMPTE